MTLVEEKAFFFFFFMTSGASHKPLLIVDASCGEARARFGTFFGRSSSETGGTWGSADGLLRLGFGRKGSAGPSHPSCRAARQRALPAGTQQESAPDLALLCPERLPTLAASVAAGSDGAEAQGLQRSPSPAAECTCPARPRGRGGSTRAARAGFFHSWKIRLRCALR